MNYSKASASLMIFAGKSVREGERTGLYSYRIHRRGSPGGQVQAGKSLAKLVLLCSAHIEQENKRKQNLFPLMATIYQDGFTLNIYDNLGEV